MQSLVLDLAGLDYISSAGIRSIFKARKALAARGGKVLVVNPQPQIQKVFDVVKAVPMNEIFAPSKKPTPTSTRCSARCCRPKRRNDARTRAEAGGAAWHEPGDLDLYPPVNGNQYVVLSGRLDSATHEQLDQALDPLLLGCRARHGAGDGAGAGWTTSAAPASAPSSKARKALAPLHGKVLAVHPQAQIRKVLDMVQALPMEGDLRQQRRGRCLHRPAAAGHAARKRRGLIAGTGTFGSAAIRLGAGRCRSDASREAGKSRLHTLLAIRRCVLRDSRRSYKGRSIQALAPSGLAGSLT